VAAWTTASTRVRELTGGKWIVPIRTAPAYPDSGDDAFIVVPADANHGCTHSWFTWTPVAGFCWGEGPGYFVIEVTVPPAAIASDAVALRALLYGSGLKPHRQPGLMNLTAPADQLSEFELKSLHMAGIRGEISWPDVEP
jgi:hypothetical protein